MTVRRSSNTMVNANDIHVGKPAFSTFLFVVKCGCSSRVHFGTAKEAFVSRISTVSRTILDIGSTFALSLHHGTDQSRV
jgi:hypothetical protein